MTELRRRAPGPAPRAGFAAFLALVVIAFVVLAVLAFSQHFLAGVTAQEEAALGGGRASLLAESALVEALGHFTAAANAPSADPASWFQRLRKPLGPANTGLEEDTYLPRLAREVDEETGARVEDVKLAFWAQAPLSGAAFEKCGLLTVTALVAMPRFRGGLVRGWLYRNVQRSYEVKVTLPGPPLPFDQYPLFVIAALDDPGVARRALQGREPPPGWADRFPRAALASLDPNVWRRKATWRFGSASDFTTRMVRDGVAHLDGICWIEGPADLAFAAFEGTGVVATAGDVTLGPCRRQGAGALTVLSGGSITLRGDVDAALLAPGGTVSAGGHRVKGLVVERSLGGEPARLEYDPGFQCGLPDGLVPPERLRVVVSPCEAGSSVLRAKG